MKKLICSFTLFAAFLFSCTTQAQIITTVAGGGTDYIGDSIPATACEINHPAGIVFDTAGNYYISDRGLGRIRKVAPDGIITTIAGGGTAGENNVPATTAYLAEPYGIAIDDAGNIYFSDGYYNRICKVNTAGIITTIAGTGIGGYNGDNIPAAYAQLYGPGGLAVDKSGNIYVADCGNNRIRRINTTGIITTIAGTGVAGYNGDGIFAAGAEINEPNWVALDTTGNLFIADSYNQRIRRIDTVGIITTVAGDTINGGYSGDGGPATAAKLNRPGSVYPDNLGNIYIGDTYNDVVRKVNAAGIITTVAGDGSAGFSGDGGDARFAWLNGPTGVVTDASNNLYIADQENDRIRMVASTLGVASVGLCERELTVWPNPSNGSFFIKIMSGSNELVQLNFTNILGEVIKKVSVNTNEPVPIQLEEHTGVYFITASSPEGTLIAKLVISP